MEESRKPKPATGADDASGQAAGHAKRDREATSGETLSDLEQSEKTGASTGASGSDTGSALEGASPKPSPDGGGGRADGGDAGGPM